MITESRLTTPRNSYTLIWIFGWFDGRKFGFVIKR